METENIFLDYEKGIFLVNGEKTKNPVRIVLKTGDGRDKAKLMNYENLTPQNLESIAELIIDICGLISLKNCPAQMSENNKKIKNEEIRSKVENNNKNNVTLQQNIFNNYFNKNKKHTKNIQRYDNINDDTEDDISFHLFNENRIQTTRSPINNNNNENKHTNNQSINVAKENYIKNNLKDDNINKNININKIDNNNINKSENIKEEKIDENINVVNKNKNEKNENKSNNNYIKINNPLSMSMAINKKTSNNLINFSSLSNKTPTKKNIYQESNTNENNLTYSLIFSNNNIFDTIGNFFSSAVNEINSYSSNTSRTDKRKEIFFEEFLSKNIPKILNTNLLLKNVISGVPERLRGKFWLKCIGNKLQITPEIFESNLQKYEDEIETENDNEKYILPFEYLGIFKQNNPLTNDLYDVINAFIISKNNINYNEKIVYIVGMLIINMDKYQAYQAFENLIFKPNRKIYFLKPINNEENLLKTGYINDTPKGDDDINPLIQINLRRVIFKHLFFSNLPDLCSHLELLDILPEEYFDEWNCTLFCKNFNIDIVTKIWDLYMIQGEVIIFNASIALLKELQEDLFECDDKEDALNILLNSQDKNLNEYNILSEIQKVKYPEWIKAEVRKINNDSIVPFNSF